MYKAKTLHMLDDILHLNETDCRYHQPQVLDSVYHPPRDTKLSGTETEFYSDLDILFTEASTSTIPVIILGDFNIHFNEEHNTSKLRNMLNDYQMQQHVNSATHEHGNILDLVITNQRDIWVSNVSVMDYAISDHYSV